MRMRMILRLRCWPSAVVSAMDCSHDLTHDDVIITKIRRYKSYRIVVLVGLEPDRGEMFRELDGDDRAEEDDVGDGSGFGALAEVVLEVLFIAEVVLLEAAAADVDVVDAEVAVDCRAAAAAAKELEAARVATELSKLGTEVECVKILDGFDVNPLSDRLTRGEGAA